MGMVTDRELDFFIDHNYNVLFRGLHGVGKTAIIKEAFERRGLNWRYFSAATMDPWVDFIGIPKEVTEDDCVESFIRLIQPETFKDGTVEVIMMDELNRAKPKVRNAVMELIQFGTINGKKLGKLRMVWAAINPEDSEDSDLSYDVDRLDPAQKDRFHCVVDIPYEPHKPYFEKMFGEAGIGAVEWWKELTPEQNIKVSPRRLEMALNVFKDGGNIRFVIPEPEINITQLKSRIDSGSIEEKLERLMNGNDEDCTRSFNNINFTNDAIPFILASHDYIEKFAPFIQNDVLSAKLTEDDDRYMEDIINYAPAETIVPILSTLISTTGCARPTRGKIKDLASARGLDLSSEANFMEAIEQALNSVDGTQTDRFAGMQGSLHNFNSKAALSVYSDTVKFFALLIGSTQMESLKSERGAYYQICTKLLHMVDDSCKSLYDTNVLEIFEGLTDTALKELSSEQLSQISEVFNLYMDNRPTT